MMSLSMIETFTSSLGRQLAHIKASRIAIAFSGGVDSSLLAKVCASTRPDVALLTVGFLNSHDIQLSRVMQQTLHLPIIDRVITLDELEEGLTQVLQVIEWNRLSQLEICLGFYFVFQLAAAVQVSTVLSAHGTDELFCGYHAYRGIFKNEVAVTTLMQDLVKTAQADKVEVVKLARLFDIDYQCPFLSTSFIEYAMNVPLDFKITHEDDSIRKHLLRSVAIQLGLPTCIAFRPKKAFQYSAGIHKALRYLAKRCGYSQSNAKRMGYESAMEAYLATLPRK